MKLFLDKDKVCHTIHNATDEMCCFEEFENDVKWQNGSPFVYGTIKEIQHEIQPVHVLLSENEIDKNYMFYNLRKYISKYDRVCILPFSFFADTKNINDWNKQYAPGQGIWYHDIQNRFYRYGIRDEQIVWVNYFTDSLLEMKKKIINSSVLLLTGGAPDLMMQRIKEKKIKKVLKNYKGVMIGYSAGAMIQFDMYHISPDEDYSKFAYESGLGCISGFDIEPHFRNSRAQCESIRKVQEEKCIPVYGIYDNGGIIIDSKMTCFGQIQDFPCTN